MVNFWNKLHLKGMTYEIGQALNVENISSNRKKNMGFYESRRILRTWNQQYHGSEGAEHSEPIVRRHIKIPQIPTQFAFGAFYEFVDFVLSLFF